VLHIAMGTHEPTRTRVSETFRPRPMGRWSAGAPGAERVTRFGLAPRGEAGPNTEVIDFYNRTLVPGIEMSGGYALFRPGGRLPAHVHDFDESICIIDGNATCVVEGETHELSDAATALVPRGRVHYFANDADRPMAMLWVYAAPTPERIVVDERCATCEGNPWGE
jgi:quercetin dioxygenase-like cupin family protein